MLYCWRNEHYLLKVEVAEQGDTLKSILFISPTGDFSNGAEQSIFQLMSYLACEGNHVFNAYPTYSPQAEADYCKTLKNAGVMPLRIPELRWWPDAPGGDINTPPNAPNDLKAVETIRQIIRENHIDIVITNTVNIYHGALASEAERVRHIWLIHEYPEGEFGYYRNKIKFISSHSDAIFCVVGTAQKTLKHLFKWRSVGSFLPFTNPGESEGEVAPSLMNSKESEAKWTLPSVNSSETKAGSSLSSASFDKAEIKTGEEAELIHTDCTTGRVVSIGLLSERKNQLELLRAYDILIKKGASSLKTEGLPEGSRLMSLEPNPQSSDFQNLKLNSQNPDLQNLELVFIGGTENDNYKQQCDDFIAKNSLTNVSFMGFRENPWAYVSENDLIVLTSKSETFGCVYTEALMNGIPVIVSNNPGFSLVNSLFGAGKLYPLGQSEALANTIKTVLNNFEAEKELALATAPKVRLAFKPENAYAEIIAKINCNKKPRRKKHYSSTQLNKLIKPTV